MAVTRNTLLRFLVRHGWRQGESGKYNIGYIPPLELELPSSYRLQVPFEADSRAFAAYSEQIEDILLEFYKYSEVKELFRNTPNILSMRTIDNDTKDGTINLERFTSILEHLKYIIRDAATFSISGLQIFNKTTQEAKDYVKMCRGLQTEEGSFVTKIQLPSRDEVLSVTHQIETEAVIGKMSNSIDFLVNEVPNVRLDRIDNSFMDEHREVISIELMSQIKNLLSSSKITHAEFSLSSNDSSSIIEAVDMGKKMHHIATFIKKSREVLLRYSPLEFRGKITRLTSKNVFGTAHQVDIETEIEGKRQLVKVILSRDDYERAIDAHRYNTNVRILGMAKHVSSYYVIDNPSSFSVE